MENNKKTYENRSKNSFRKSFFVHHQAAWGLLHPTSGCSTMARRCFNAASGKRSVATAWLLHGKDGFMGVSMPQAARGLLQLVTLSPVAAAAGQVSMPQAARGLLQQYDLSDVTEEQLVVSMPQAARGLLQHCVLEAAWTLAWKWGFGQPPRKSTHLALFSRGHRFVFSWKTGFIPCCWRVQRVHEFFGQPTPVLTCFRGCPTVF